MGQSVSQEYLQRRLDEVRQATWQEHEKQRLILADRIIELEEQLAEAGSGREVVEAFSEEYTDAFTLSVRFRRGGVPRVSLQELVNEVADHMNRMATDYPNSGYRHYSSTEGHPGVRISTVEEVHYQ